jgi:hypothetical protein
VPVNADNTFLLFKERRPFKLKKEYPSEQWQIISFRLIPLKTPVSFHWTVPFNNSYTVKSNPTPNTNTQKHSRKASLTWVVIVTGAKLQKRYVLDF